MKPTFFPSKKYFAFQVSFYIHTYIHTLFIYYVFLLFNNNDNNFYDMSLFYTFKVIAFKKIVSIVYIFLFCFVVINWIEIYLKKE